MAPVSMLTNDPCVIVPPVPINTNPEFSELAPHIVSSKLLNKEPLLRLSIVKFVNDKALIPFDKISGALKLDVKKTLIFIKDIIEEVVEEINTKRLLITAVEVTLNTKFPIEVMNGCAELKFDNKVTDFVTVTVHTPFWPCKEVPVISQLFDREVLPTTLTVGELL
jgi:hypothetical protein